MNVDPRPLGRDEVPGLMDEDQHTEHDHQRGDRDQKIHEAIEGWATVT